MDFEQTPARVVTALVQISDPRRNKMRITIAGNEFANHSYDERGDVLYVDIEGYDGSTFSSQTDATPEGPGIEWDEDGHVIAQARAKTDRLDAWTLAKLLGAGELGVWRPDEHPRVLRRRLSQRQPLMRALRRAKNEVHAALMRQLKGHRRCPTCPASRAVGSERQAGSARATA